MNRSNGRFCQLYRPLGALLLALAILFLFLRPCGVQQPTAIVPKVEPTQTVLPTALPTQTALLTALPTQTALPTVPPMAELPTIAPLAVPQINPLTAADLTAEGVRLSGTGEPGATIEVWDGTTKLGTAVVDADGLWTLPAKLSEGTHQLVMRTMDAAGNVLIQETVAEVTVPAAETPVGPEDLTTKGEAYIVQPGDWLIKLARRFYGDPYLYIRIIDGTNAKAAVDSTFAVIRNPNLILVGQKLWIPAPPSSK